MKSVVATHTHTDTHTRTRTHTHPPLHTHTDTRRYTPTNPPMSCVLHHQGQFESQRRRLSQLERRMEVQLEATPPGGAELELDLAGGKTKQKDLAIPTKQREMRCGTTDIRLVRYVAYMFPSSMYGSS